MRTVFQVPVKRKTEDRAESGPAYDVPAGAVVEVSKLSGNAATAYYSTVGADAAKAGGPRDEFASTNTVPRRVTVRNLSDLWVYSSTIGEGLMLTVLYP